MRCYKCGKAEVNFHFTSNINGRRAEMYLCADCAAKSEYRMYQNNKNNPVNNGGFGLSGNPNGFFPLFHFQPVHAVSGDGNSMLNDNRQRSQTAAKQNKCVKTETKTLDQFSRDLTDAAAEGKLDPVVGRDEEIQRVIQILSRRTKNNPVLIGEPGVGKTAVAEGLARMIVEGDVPETLQKKRIVSLDLTAMVAGTKYRGEFEERIKEVIEEVRLAEDVVLFVDELHTLIGAGSAEGSMDAANIVKPMLGRGEVQIIGATTLNEYRKHIEKDAALERRFQPVIINEPTQEESIEILKGLRDRYEAHHGLKICDEAIVAAVNMSARYINDRFLPDKAIDLIDEASSRVRMEGYKIPDELKNLHSQREKLRAEKEAAISKSDFENAALIHECEQKIENMIEAMNTERQKSHAEKTLTVAAEDIAKVVSAWTGIPVTAINEDESDKLLKIEEILHGRIVGQDKAVSAVAKAIRRGRVGLKDPKRPVGTFLFLGPTGVGKTELCKALAEAMFGDEKAMIRIDMSEYMDKHTSAKLIGSPPGYVGYDEGGQLTEKIRRKPYSVILFDEIEKAHEDVWNVMLQVMEDGILTDSQGRRVDFRNTVIVMTSNAGARNITEKTGKLGFETEKQSENASEQQRVEKAVMDDVKRLFKPEFLNRIDEMVVFHKLTQEDIIEVCDKMLIMLVERLHSLGIELVVTEDVKKHLAEQGYDPVYGARPLRRTIQSKVEDMLAEKLLDGSISKGDTITLELVDGVITAQQVSEDKLDGAA